jgi:hypothetical protein
MKFSQIIFGQGFMKNSSQIIFKSITKICLINNNSCTKMDINGVVSIFSEQNSVLNSVITINKKKYCTKIKNVKIIDNKLVLFLDKPCKLPIESCKKMVVKMNLLKLHTIGIISCKYLKTYFDKKKFTYMRFNLTNHHVVNISKDSLTPYSSKLLPYPDDKYSPNMIYTPFDLNTYQQEAAKRILEFYDVDTSTSASTMRWDTTDNQLGVDQLGVCWDQGACGDCWLMASASAFLACALIKYNSSVSSDSFRPAQSLNVSYLNEAGTSAKTSLGCACNGGWPLSAYQAIATYGIMDDTAAYASGFNKNCVAFFGAVPSAPKNSIASKPCSSRQMTCGNFCRENTTCTLALAGSPNPMGQTSQKLIIDPPLTTDDTIAEGQNGPFTTTPENIQIVSTNISVDLAKTHLTNCGPIIVSVNAAGFTTQSSYYYPITGLKSEPYANHVMIVTGWTTYPATNGSPYWVVRNQFGSTWKPPNGCVYVAIGTYMNDSFYEIVLPNAACFNLGDYNFPNTAAQWTDNFGTQDNPCSACPPLNS